MILTTNLPCYFIKQLFLIKAILTDYFQWLILVRPYETKVFCLKKVETKCAYIEKGPINEIIFNGNIL